MSYSLGVLTVLFFMSALFAIIFILINSSSLKYSSNRERGLKSHLSMQITSLTTDSVKKVSNYLVGIPD